MVDVFSMSFKRDTNETLPKDGDCICSYEVHFGMFTPPFTLFCCQKHQLMTAGLFHVTKLTPRGSDNPSRVHGQTHLLMTAGMFHVTNLTPRGSDNPSRVHGQNHLLMTACMFHVTNLTPRGSECNP